MVLDGDDVRKVKVRVRPGRVGDDQQFDPQRLHDAHGERHFLHRVAFVEMEAAFHHDNWQTDEGSADELTGMGLHGRVRHVGDVGVRDFHLPLDLLGKRPEACPEDDADFGRGRESRCNCGAGCFDLGEEVGHGGRTLTRRNLVDEKLRGWNMCVEDAG